MKKFAVMLIAGAAFLMLGAAELDVNGAFGAPGIRGPGSRYPGALPHGWEVLEERVGRYEIRVRENKNKFCILSCSSPTFGLVSRKSIRVSPGERYRLSVEARGRGVTANTGAYFYCGKPVGSKTMITIDIGDGDEETFKGPVHHRYPPAKILGDYKNPVRLTGTSRIISRVITVPSSVKGDRPHTMRVFFYVKWPGKMAEFSNFKLEKLSGGRTN